MKNASEKFDIYEMVTERILALLSQGNIPWHKPWNSSNDSFTLPRNYVSKKEYKGINVFLLACAGFECPYWVSYKQAASLGGQVKKGEKGFPVVFWKPLPKINKETGQPVLNAKGKPEMVFFLRYYTVFNLAQCEGIAWEKPAVCPSSFSPIEEAEKIVSNMPNKPMIKNGGGRAFYSPSLDFVGIPSPESFSVREEYYSTLFHELTHSTGHKTRLARKGFEEGELAAFGSASYAREELVAEMGAAFLCGFSGIANVTIENSAAYIQNWSKALKEDSKLVVFAASQAHKAADYILNKKEEAETEE